MQVRAIVLPGGQLQVFVDDGTYEEAAEATAQLFARLRAAGVAVEQTSAIESHKDGGSHAHVHTTVKGHGH